MKIYTKEWYKQENKPKEEFDKMRREYEQVTENSYIPEKLKKELHMHDALVESFFMDGNDMVITFDHAHSASATDEARFKQVLIKVNDGICCGDSWLYEEIYSRSDGYELHVLFSDGNDYPKELIIIFKDVIFLNDPQKTKRQQDLLEKLTKVRTGE